MDTAPTCLRCKVQMVFLRFTKSSQEGAARSLFECPSCFRIKKKAPWSMSIPSVRRADLSRVTLVVQPPAEL